MHPFIVHVVKGREPVLRLGSRLIEFGERCGQTGAMQDLGFFLSKPGALPRVPYLLLVTESQSLDLENPKLDDLVGVVLLFEFQMAGVGTGAFATNDRSGRSTLIARPEDRLRVAKVATRTLLDRGAEMILMSFRVEDTAGEPLPEESEEEAEPAASRNGVGKNGIGAATSLVAMRVTSLSRRAPLLTVQAGERVTARWTWRERTIPGYLPLAESFDATLARVGQRTRSNLRYYRRRAESKLGCRFLPEIAATREEVMDFSRECMYTVPVKTIGWRYDSLKEMENPMFMGVKDGEGRWLSMLGGRRYNDRSEILWQLNRDGYGTDSIGTVMRSYCIEHEIGRGSKRLYIEGGTPHPIRFSFLPERLTDLVVMRDSVTAKAMRQIARRYISGDNELSLMLRETDLEWFPC